MQTPEEKRAVWLEAGNDPCKVEFWSTADSMWISCSDMHEKHPAYRLKKQTVTKYNIHTGEAVQVPAPLTKRPEVGADYYYFDLTGVCCYKWEGDHLDEKAFITGIHLNDEDSREYWSKILGVEIK